MTPTPNAPIWSSWARSGLRAPALTTLKSRPASGLRSMMIAPASVPLLTFSVAVCGVGNDLERERALGGGVGGQRRVEERVEGLDGALRERGVRRRDPDPRDRRPVEQPDPERDQRHDDREAHQQQRREQEGAGLHALDVLAARDEPDVDPRGAHAASSPDAGTGASPGSVPPPPVAPVAVPRPSAGRRCVTSSTGRPTKSTNTCSRLGSASSKWVTRAPTRDRGREDDVRRDALLELDRRAVHADLDDPRARDVREPRQPVVALDRDAHHLPPGRATDLAQRAADHHAPAVDDRDRLAQGLGDLHLVRREDDGAAAVAELEERLAQEHHVDGVEAGERLVHQQDLRVVEHGGDELDLLLVALGQLLGAALREVFGAEPAQPAERVAPGPVRRDALEAREEHELVQHLHPRVEPALLGEIAPGRARQQLALGAPPRDPAGVGLEDAERDPHRRRLAGPVRAEEPEDLARGDLEREIVERDDGAEPLGEVVDDEGHGQAGDDIGARAYRASSIAPSGGRSCP